MKKGLVVLLTGMVLFGCSTSDDSCPVNPDNNTPIEMKFSTGVHEVNVTKTVVNESTPINAIFVAASAANTYGTYLWSDTISFNASSTTSAAFSFTPKRYYPSSNTSVFVKAYYPNGTIGSTNNLINYATTDGSLDVLFASEQSGSRQTAPTLNFTFNHLLSQLQFKFVAGTNYPAGKTVTSLVIKNAQTFPTQLDLNTGLLTYSASNISFTGKSYSISSSGTVIPDTPMVAPANSVVLSITTSDGVTYPDLTVSGVTTAVGN